MAGNLGDSQMDNKDISGETLMQEAIARRKKPVIVIIEDDADHSEVLARVFGDISKIVEVSSGDHIALLDNGEIEAVVWSKDKEDNLNSETIKERADFYIFDLRMPDVNGIECWEKLAKPSKGYAFLTIWAEDEHWVLRLSEAGVDINRVISKDADSLNTTVDRLRRIMEADGVL